VTAYLPCAGSPISLPAAADTTGNNPGNLTNAFTVNVLGTMPPVYEWYRAVIGTQNPAQIASLIPAPCAIYMLNKPISFTYPAGGSEWDPSQPIPLRNGYEIYFYWQLAASTTPVPLVTLFLRYDADNPANQAARGTF
jgi:hypothetical protein